MRLLVWTLYYDRHPQGAIVGSYSNGSPSSPNTGVSHAIDIYDFATNVEPGSAYPALQIQGFYVLDPWYGAGFGSIGLPKPYPHPDTRPRATLL